MPIGTGGSLPAIALVGAGELYGGVERHILTMLEALRPALASVSLLLFHDRELAAAARSLGIEPDILPAGNRSLAVAVRRLAAIIASRGIRIVHAHGYKSTVCCALARARERFALVKTEHGLPEDSPSWGIKLKSGTYYWLDGLAAHAAKASVCYVTDELRTRCERRHRGLRVTVIPNGIGPPPQHRLARPAAYHREWFNLLIVGRLEPVKGHRYAIEALARAALARPAHLHIVGAGSAEDALRAAAAANSVADRVHFAGFRPDASSYIAHCDALLIPSLHEGLPFVLLEGMSLAVPIVASAVGGLAEVLTDGSTGLLTPPGDSAAIAYAVGRLHDDAALRDRIRLQARTAQASHYSLDAMTKSYIREYQAAVLDAWHVPTYS